MAPGNTTTGQVLEQTVLPALARGGYTVQTQVSIGKRPGGRNHIADAVVTAPDTGREYLISLKWQQVSGTAEQKVPFEVICLAEAIRLGSYEKAYLVLGGEGWSLRKYYVDGGLAGHLQYSHLVSIVTLERFIGIANSGKL